MANLVSIGGLIELHSIRTCHSIEGGGGREGQGVVDILPDAALVLIVNRRAIAYGDKSAVRQAEVLLRLTAEIGDFAYHMGTGKGVFG